MKIQDAVFFVLFAVLIFLNRPKWLVIIGLICLGLSIPLFATWTFFTAERLTWYAAAFFLGALLI